MRPVLIGTILFTACSGSGASNSSKSAEPVERTITAQTLDSLPQFQSAPGRLVCLADGIAPCPMTPATANWLADGKYATWEAERPVLIWTPGKVDPQLLGAAGMSDSQFNAPMSAAATRSGYIVVNMNPPKALLYDRNLKYVATLPMPPITLSRARGYAGSVPFFQMIHEGAPDSAAEFEIRLINAPGDTIGKSILKTKLGWLKLRNGRPYKPLPIFPTLPAYAVAPDSDIVWSPGDTFAFERRSATGAIRWKVRSDIPGAVFSQVELDSIRVHIPAGDKARQASFDSSLAVSGKNLPAVGAVTLSPKGRVLVSDPQLSTHDSVHYVVLGETGAPIGRFAWPRRTRALLFGDDSVLVQRAGANGQQELRWLLLTKP